MSIITLNSDQLQIFRDQESRETNSHLKAMSENNHEVTVKSNGSDQSVESSSVGDGDSTLSPEEVETMVKLQHSPLSSVFCCTYGSKFLSMHAYWYIIILCL